MVTVLPKENDWGDAFSSIGKGATEGYMDRADEMALQKAVKSLPEGYTSRQLLDAVTGVKTYRNEAKKEFLKNASGLAKEEREAKAENEKFNETKRHNEASEQIQLKKAENTLAIATNKNVTTKEIAEGKYKSSELIASEKNIASAEKTAQEVGFKKEHLAFEKDKAADDLELAKKKLENTQEASKKKLELSEAAEKRKDTQGAEKLRQEAEALNLKAEEQKIKVDQFEKQFSQKNDHYDRTLQFDQLKQQQLLDAKAEQSNIKLQEIQKKYDQQEAELEEKKRQFDQQYELSLSKDLREQDKAQAELDKIKHQIEHDQNVLNATTRYRDEQQAIAREQNDIAWKKLEKTNPSEFEKVRQIKAAEEYRDLEHELPKLYETRNDIENIKKLSEKLGWSAAPKSLFGAESPAQMEALSYKLLEAPIHVFNPGGVLAFKKLDQLRAIYHIKATDAPGTRKGKAEALGYFNDQAIKLAEDRINLIKQYNGPPPLNVVEQSKKDGESMIDAMIDYDFNKEEVSIPGLPKADEKNKGRTITDKQTGLKYISDGVRWTKK